MKIHFGSLALFAVLFYSSFLEEEQKLLQLVLLGASVVLLCYLGLVGFVSTELDLSEGGWEVPAVIEVNFMDSDYFSIS